MAFKLSILPYSTDALEPYISKKTLEFHYGKHHKKYVENLNKFTEGTHFEHLSLEEVLTESFERNDNIFNNAAQTWNHTFFWDCLSPDQLQISNHLQGVLKEQFHSLAEFKEKFTASAKGLFGSGWTWLVKDPGGRLSIKNMENAGNPLTENSAPLLACDVWEHAYYLDYQNDRPKFLDNFWEIVNWDFVEDNLREKDKYPKAPPGKNVIETPASAINAH